MPRHDPYLEDRNIRTAAGLQLVASLFLGAMLGWAIVSWFDLGLGEGAGAAIGAGAGFVLSNLLIYRYGGRSTL
jgi:hypothetical protein